MSILLLEDKETQALINAIASKVEDKLYSRFTGIEDMIERLNDPKMMKAFGEGLAKGMRGF